MTKPNRLDIEQRPQLLAYCGGGTNRAQRTAEDHRLHGGVSNRTVLVERSSGERLGSEQALAKLRTAVSGAAIQSALSGRHWEFVIFPRLRDGNGHADRVREIAII